MPHHAPREHLPGDAAGGRPGWEDRLLALVNDDQREKTDRRGVGRNWPARLNLTCDIEFRQLLRAAADARGLSVSGYMRRATAAFIAADLDLPYATVTSLTPKPLPSEGVRGLPADQYPLHNPGKQRDDGLGYGTWRVCRD